MNTRHSTLIFALSLVACRHVTRIHALAVSIGIDRGLPPRRRDWRFWRRSPGPIHEQAPPTATLLPLPQQLPVQHQSAISIRTQVYDLSRTFEAVYMNHHHHGDDIDTISLLAALRQAELTLRRAGQRTNANDLGNNIQKVQAVYERAPAGVRESMTSLLEYEKNLGVHKSATGTLSETSAAMALLWVRRNISFQHQLYHLVLTGMAPPQAAAQAYRAELEPFHGWALRKVSTLALKSTSVHEKHDLLVQLSGLNDQAFGPAEAQATEEELRHLVSLWNPVRSIVQLPVLRIVHETQVSSSLLKLYLTLPFCFSVLFTSCYGNGKRSSTNSN